VRLTKKKKGNVEPFARTFRCEAVSVSGLEEGAKAHVKAQLDNNNKNDDDENNDDDNKTESVASPSNTDDDNNDDDAK
jgi:hypothetical protein